MKGLYLGMSLDRQLAAGTDCIIPGGIHLYHYRMVCTPGVRQPIHCLVIELSLHPMMRGFDHHLGIEAGSVGVWMARRLSDVFIS